LSTIRTPTPRTTKKITIAAAATVAVAAGAGTATAAESPRTTPGVRQVSASDAAAASVWPAQTLISRTDLDAVAAVHASTVTASQAKARHRHRIHRPTARQIARMMLPGFGWQASQFGYLSLLWNRESGWQVFASNPSTGAYGIPQAMPGSKMASAGANWATSARTQIRWGLRYIEAQYGSPYYAWQHELAAGWY
jgi:hypothetical protein